MKVYLVWDDGDYYGPYPITEANFVYSTLEKAKEAAEKRYARSRTTPLVWVQKGDDRWDAKNANYYIEEVEPE